MESRSEPVGEVEWGRRPIIYLDETPSSNERKRKVKVGARHHGEANLYDMLLARLVMRFVACISLCYVGSMLQ